MRCPAFYGPTFVLFLEPAVVGTAEFGPKSDKNMYLGGVVEPTAIFTVVRS